MCCRADRSGEGVREHWPLPAEHPPYYPILVPIPISPLQKAAGYHRSRALYVPRVERIDSLLRLCERQHNTTSLLLIRKYQTELVPAEVEAATSQRILKVATAPVLSAVGDGQLGTV